MDLKTFSLLALTAGNALITYATGIVLARSLGIGHYDEYAVAVAAVTILSTFSELGAGKLAMRILPAYAENGEWGAARGYRRLAVRAILLASLLVAGVIFIPQLVRGGAAGITVLGVAVLFLPVMALTGYGAEVVQANHAPLRAALVSRAVVPSVTLAVVAGWVLVAGELTAAIAVVLFGSGWVAGLILVRSFLVQTTAPELSSAPIVVTPRQWFSQAVPFLFFALLLVAMTKTGLLVLQRVASDSDVSRFAVALETGMLLYLIAKSTDKMFLPRLSILLERRDVAALIRMRNRRLLWVGAVCLAFLTVVVLFGRDLLALFGPRFGDGYAALIIVSGATAVWTLFSLAPSYLQYVGRARFVVRATAGCVLASVVLTWELGARYGDIGAAIAFAAPVALLYAVFATHAWQHVMSAVEGAGPPGPPVR